MAGRSTVVVAYGERPANELLRTEVASFVGVAATAVVLGRACPRCGGDDHGRPVLLATARMRTPPHVSVSRAGALSVVAVTHAGPVGVDVEPVDAAGFRSLDDVSLHPSERATGADPARVWVRKEAVLKACGLGLVVDPGHLALDGDGIAVWDSPHPRPERLLVRDLDVPGHLAAVAVMLDQASSSEVVLTVRATGR